MAPISAHRHALALCDPRRGCGLFPDRLDRDLADDAAIYGILDDRNFARGGQGHRSSGGRARGRSEEHTSELQSLMRTSYAVSYLQTTNPKAYNIQSINTQ